MKFRKPLKITSRTSSVTNGFVQAIIPSIEPTQREIAEALAVLGMTPEAIMCVYCGAPATDWDHLRPLVKSKKPTGYFNSIKNLVPACGPCNQSKGGQDWHTWIYGTARGSPRARMIPDLDARIARLEAYEKWSNHEPIDLATIIGRDRWNSYWQQLEDIEAAMHKAQLEATQIREAISAALRDGGAK